MSGQYLTIMPLRACSNIFKTFIHIFQNIRRFTVSELLTEKLKVTGTMPS
jgi:hypothetical protein